MILIWHCDCSQSWESHLCSFELLNLVAFVMLLTSTNLELINFQDRRLLLFLSWYTEKVYLFPARIWHFRADTVNQMFLQTLVQCLLTQDTAPGQPCPLAARRAPPTPAHPTQHTLKGLKGREFCFDPRADLPRPLFTKGQAPQATWSSPPVKGIP